MTVLPPSTPSHEPIVPRPAEKSQHRYVVWALNSKVKRWQPVVGGIGHLAGIEEIKKRQERLRADGRFECRFKLLPEGANPNE